LTYSSNLLNAVHIGTDKNIEEYKPYVPMLRTALELSKKIRLNREKRGAIDFDKPESKIVVDENLFTCSGPANALDLSLLILEKMTSKENVEIVKKNMFLK